MNYLVCPLYQRPAFLEVWIECLRKVKGAPELFYIFAIDYGAYPQNERILKERFPYQYAVIHTPKTKYRLAKQSYNVLNALMAAAINSDGLIFYLEEDVFPGIDFINWHIGIHSREKEIFCSIASRNNNTKVETSENPSRYYLSMNPDYQALGSCFKSKIINELIYPHFTEDYFNNPISYCVSQFPDSIIGRDFVEQDGLIRRIVEKSGLPIAFPHYPRCYHAGFYGYHRKHHAQRMPLSKQIEAIKRIAFSDENMRKENKHPEYYEDSKPINLEIESSIFIRDK